MNCKNCGQRIPEIYKSCPYCKDGLGNPKKRSKSTISNISLFLSILPYILFILVAVRDEVGFGAGAFLFSICIPMLIVATIIAVIALIVEGRLRAFISLLIAAAPVLFLL